MKSVKTICFILMLILLQACGKDQLPGNEINPPEENMEELIIPQNFDRESSSSVDVTISVTGFKSYAPRNNILFT